MTFLKRATIAGLAGATLLLSAGTGPAQEDIVYRWVDDDGTVHFTQGQQSIPPRFRPRAVPLGSVGGARPPAAGSGEALKVPEPIAPVAPPPPVRQRPPAPLNAPERVAVDEAYEKARTTEQYLAVSQGYLGLGLPLGAKSAADSAARVAVTSRDWEGVANTYAAIGETAAAAAARKKAEQLSQQERARRGSPR